MERVVPYSMELINASYIHGRTLSVIAFHELQSLVGQLPAPLSDKLATTPT